MPQELFSKNGEYPEVLDRIRLSNGMTRTDSSTYTKEELSSYGYSGPYYEPEYDSEIQELTWDSENLKFVLKDRPRDYWISVLKERRNNLLSRTDWTQLDDSPLTVDKKEEWKIYRQKLRDLPNNLPSQIPTDLEEADSLIFPTMPS